MRDREPTLGSSKRPAGQVDADEVPAQAVNAGGMDAGTTADFQANAFARSMEVAQRMVDAEERDCQTNGTSLCQAVADREVSNLFDLGRRSRSAAMIFKAAAGVARVTPVACGLTLERPASWPQPLAGVARERSALP